MLLMLPGPAMAGATKGVMSVNQCMEQMVASLDAQQLASVTWLSHQSHAPLYDRLRQIPANYGNIEEVLSIQPDWVLAGQYGAPGLKQMLNIFSIRWRELPLHQNFQMLADNWSQLGQWLQREKQAATIIRDIEQNLAKINSQLKPLSIKTLMVNPRGWVAGNDNFQHAFLEAIGLINLAATQGLQGWSQISHEQLLIWQPDLIIVVQTGYRGHSRATEWLHHPALAEYKPDYPLFAATMVGLDCSAEAPGRFAQAIYRHITQFSSAQGLPAIKGFATESRSLAQAGSIDK